MARDGLIICLFYSCVACFYLSCHAEVELKNNGYEGVVVMIKDTVKEDPELIDRIKEVFTEASSVLFTATRYRAYFRDITIVVPKKWRKLQKYQKIPSANVFYEHIRVDRKNKAKGHAPYVRGNVECGKPGWYLHLTPKFLKNEKKKRFGPHANAVVHEWGHLRWGLFDEYGSIQHPNSTKPSHKIHFYSKGGEWKPVTCVRGIEGRAYKGCKKSKPCNSKSLKMPPSCKFCPNKKQIGVNASIMAYQWIPGVDSFCDVDHNSTDPNIRHDSSVPNMQNKMCDGKSAWEVMREHDDFRAGRNPPISRTTNTTPSFRLVQETGRVRVLVFDTSGSMKGEKIVQQRRAAYLAINTFIEKGSKLGIVKFDTYGSLEAPIKQVKGKKSKKYFKDKIPVTAGGGTEIKHGIRKAIHAIEISRSPTKGSEIILLSDGDSNHQYLDIIHHLKYKGIVVNTIAITDQADKDLAKLSKATGGHSFTYLQTSTVSFADVLSQAMLSGSIDSDTPEKIFTENFQLSSDTPFSGTFEIEQGLGMDTTITAMLNVTDYFLIHIEVTAPNGTVYSVEEVSDILTLDIEGYVEPGEYNYNISTNSSIVVDVAVTVTSSQSSLEDDVIRVTSYLSHDTVDFTTDDKDIIIFANVEKGGNPVLGANVTALLGGNQSFVPKSIKLQDTGKGADTSPGDGIYSAFILKKFFTGNSRYNIKLFVSGDNGTFTYTTDLNIGEKAAVVPGEEEDLDYQEVKTDRFKREVIPGEITVKNFVAIKGDITPPAKITDLAVQDIEYVGEGADMMMVFTLQWTAVGDDMDEGQAAAYDIRMHADPDVLRHNFSSVSSTLKYNSVPKPSGQYEMFTLKLTQQDCNGTCYVAMTTTDDDGLTGDISNLVNVDVNFNYEPYEDDDEEEDKDAAAAAAAAASDDNDDDDDDDNGGGDDDDDDNDDNGDDDRKGSANIVACSLTMTISCSVLSLMYYIDSLIAG